MCALLIVAVRSYADPACQIGIGCIPPPGYPACDGDTNCDGQADAGDLLIVLENWGYAGIHCCGGDLTCDGHRDVDDILVVLDDWGCGS